MLESRVSSLESFLQAIPPPTETGSSRRVAVAPALSRRSGLTIAVSAARDDGGCDRKLAPWNAPLSRQPVTAAFPLGDSAPPGREGARGSPGVTHRAATARRSGVAGVSRHVRRDPNCARLPALPAPLRMVLGAGWWSERASTATSPGDGPPSVSGPRSRERSQSAPALASRCLARGESPVAGSARRATRSSSQV